jgi:hypothetical protein
MPSPTSANSSDYIVTYGKLLDERGKLKPPGLLWFEQVELAA